MDGPPKGEGDRKNVGTRSDSEKGWQLTDMLVS